MGETPKDGDCIVVLAGLFNRGKSGERMVAVIFLWTNKRDSMRIRHTYTGRLHSTEESGRQNGRCEFSIDA